MQDLEIAKKRLCEKGLTLSIVKKGKIVFEAATHGISGVLSAIEKFEYRLNGASVADKVVGKAIALLCVYAKIKSVYASTLSREAKRELEENAVYIEWESLVANILNVNGKETCPLEKLAAQILDPNKAYVKLKAFQAPFRKCQ
jgi:hypothetical protein